MKRAKAKASATSDSSAFGGGGGTSSSPPKKKKTAVPDPSIIITNTSDGPQQQFQCKVCGRYVQSHIIYKNTVKIINFLYIIIDFMYFFGCYFEVSLISVHY